MKLTNGRGQAQVRVLDAPLAHVWRTASRMARLNKISEEAAAVVQV